jgi:hypothetical protein
MNPIRGSHQPVNSADAEEYPLTAGYNSSMLFTSKIFDEGN